MTDNLKPFTSEIIHNGKTIGKDYRDWFETDEQAISGFREIAEDDLKFTVERVELTGNHAKIYVQ